ncbi:unnamed protein product [Prorocentrum cordatum]|uniref:Uncharacterized protein n=1 Tax=Prorocentrum cordatum TaxID=2364126 RepID=A0ABN9PP37_9DINO|nr:unnamed protein product [Polarella glacialis]
MSTKTSKRDKNTRRETGKRGGRGRREGEEKEEKTTCLKSERCCTRADTRALAQASRLRQANVSSQSPRHSGTRRKLPPAHMFDSALAFTEVLGKRPIEVPSF